MKQLPKKLKISMIITSLMLIISICVYSFSNRVEAEEYSVEENTIEILLKEVEEQLSENRDSIIYQVGFYINSKIKRHEMCIEHLFDICEMYNIDIRLPMVQGWIESHYGTAGLAKSTRSIFNVGAFDGKSYNEINPKFKYETVNCSLEPYAILISEKYMFDQRTENDLLNNFVDINGSRYATAERYEAKLRTVWQNINNTTKLDSLLNERNRLKTYYNQYIYLL